MIKYADEAVGPYKLHRREVAKRVIPNSGGVTQAPGQGQDGYGSKITTDICVIFDGQKKERRVYATCFSNAASHWLLVDGEKLHLRTHFQDEILD